MTNKYDPRNNIPGYIPAAPILEQGFPLPGAPLTLEGCSQEDLRREMMRRTGQYGPLPTHRVRGAIGGQNVTLQVDTAATGQQAVQAAKAQWQTLLRDDHWTEDATGFLNASFKTLVTLGAPSALYTSGTPGNPLGMIVKLRFGVGGTTMNELIFDVPSNGMVHVPFCGETVIAEVALERKVLLTVNTWQPDKPRLDPLNLVNSGLTTPPQVSGAIVPGQGLASSFINNATRQIAYNLVDTVGDTVDVPIPRGTQAFRVSGGPSDLTVDQVIPHDSAGNQPETVPVTPDTIEPLFSNATAIRISSAADGGIVALWFYLGI